MPFDATNWYWFVGGDTTRVYSSKVGDYVPTNDPTFLAWKAADTLRHIPAGIATEALLGQELAPFLARPIAANVLDGYKQSLAVGVVNAVQFKILFNHENRIRAIERALSLNGSPADLTAGQAIAAVKALM